MTSVLDCASNIGDLFFSRHVVGNRQRLLPDKRLGHLAASVGQ